MSRPTLKHCMIGRRLDTAAYRQEWKRYGGQSSTYNAQRETCYPDKHKVMLPVTGPIHDGLAMTHVRQHA